MPTIHTTVTVFARDAHDRDHIYFDGVDGTEDKYGVIEVVRATKTTRRAEGNVARVLDEHVREEVLATLDADGATHLMRTLAKATVNALQVKPAVRPYKDKP